MCSASCHSLIVSFITVREKVETTTHVQFQRIRLAELYGLVPCLPVLILLISLLASGGCSSRNGSRVSLDGEWRFAVDSSNIGANDEWFRPSFDRSAWRNVPVPQHWEQYGLEEYDGVGWFETFFEVASVDSPLALFFEGVDDEADVWVNGIKVGHHVGFRESFFLEIRQAVKEGSNLLVMRVSDVSGPGGIYKPVSLVPLREVEQLARSPYADLHARQSEAWVRDAVLYQVSLRSFSPEGTFKSLEEKLPRLRELGVTVLCLVPIHPVGELNRQGTLGNPYAVQDYYAIDPSYGSMNDLKSLVQSAHRQRMKVILDFAGNHTAWDAQLLMEHSDWYTTNRQGAVVSPNADWSDVADLNYNHHELRKYMTEVMKYWVREAGIDGFRCTVSELVPTDFWERARKELEKIRPVLMIAEGNLPEHHLEAFDLTVSYDLPEIIYKILSGTLPASALDQFLKTESHRFPQRSLRVRSSSDLSSSTRIVSTTVYSSLEEMKAAALLAWTIPGIPLIVNGEEVGDGQSGIVLEHRSHHAKIHPEMTLFYQRLGTLRANQPALRHHGYTTLVHQNQQDVVAFLREGEEHQVIVVVNCSPRQKQVEIDLAGRQDGVWKDFFSGGVLDLPESKLMMTLPAYGYRVLIRE